MIYVVTTTPSTGMTHLARCYPEASDTRGALRLRCQHRLKRAGEGMGEFERACAESERAAAAAAKAASGLARAAKQLEKAAQDGDIAKIHKATDAVKSAEEAGAAQEARTTEPRLAVHGRAGRGISGLKHVRVNCLLPANECGLQILRQDDRLAHRSFVELGSPPRSPRGAS